jgi:hypothetical protein
MRKIVIMVLMGFTLLEGVQAHELQANRATLVLRDRHHLSLTFFVDYVSLLHQTLAPQRSLNEFVLMYSTVQPQVLKAQLHDVQRKLQEGTVLTLSTGKKASLTQWAWPNAQRVQTLLQAHAMEAVVSSTHSAQPHTHGDANGDSDQIQIRAEVKSSNAEHFASVTLQLPPQFQNVLVVSYQPKQVWLKPAKPSAAIRF